MMNNQWSIHCASYAPSSSILTSLHALYMGLYMLMTNTINAIKNNDTRQLQSNIVIGVTCQYTYRIINEKINPPSSVAILVEHIISTLTSLSIWGRRPIHVVYSPINPSNRPPGTYWPQYIHNLAKHSTNINNHYNPYDFKSASSLAYQSKFRINNSPLVHNMPSYITPRHILSPTTLPSCKGASRLAIQRMIKSTSNILLALNNFR